MSQKESEWEKEFEKVMGCIPECASGLYEDVGCPAHGYDAMKSVKFFRGVLSKREKEIAEGVNKLLPKDWAEKADKAKKEGDMYTGGFFMGMIDTVEKVLQILKH